MGQVLHGGATATEAARRAIQAGEEGVRAPARRHGTSPTPARKRRGRRTVADERTGPKRARSTAPSPGEEAVIVAFRRRTPPPPPDDRLHALRPATPRLGRSSPRRRLQRHGITRLPDTDGDEPGRPRLEARPIGFLHIGIAEVRAEEAGRACPGPSTARAGSPSSGPWRTRARRGPRGSCAT